MKANLFALFCITLFVLSVPQAFAEDTSSTVTADQTVEQNSTEAPVTDGIEAVSAPVEEQPKVGPTEPAPQTQETAPVKNSVDEEDAAEESGAAADADTEAIKPEEDAGKVQAVEPVNNGTESNPKTAPVGTETAPEGEQDSTEQVVADKSDDEVIASSGEENKTEDNVADTAVESKETTETNETDETNETIGTTETAESTETPETPETPVVAPTETPGSTNATNATNAEPVSSPEESQEAAPAAEESQETAPVAESEEQLEKKDGLSLFGLISKVLVGLGILSVVILVGCVYHYRYQMQKYKIAPFTPPSFLPECLFPRNTESSGRLISGYTELQVGNYQSAPRFAEI